MGQFTRRIKGHFPLPSDVFIHGDNFGESGRVLEVSSCLLLNLKENFSIFKLGSCVYIFGYVNDSYLPNILDLVQKMLAVKKAAVAGTQSSQASRPST